MSTPSPTPELVRRGSTRYHSLDFWRGFAALVVLLSHSSFYLTQNPDQPIPQSGIGKLVCKALHMGYLGVPLFFVVSGYCITAACMGTKGGVGNYFLRRFRRIYPPAWVCLLLSGAIYAVLVAIGRSELMTDSIQPLTDPRTLTVIQWIGNFTLTEIPLSRLMGREFVLFLGPYWSLCYEEQFYAVCGLALLFCKTPQRFFSIMFVVTGLVIAIVLAGAGRKSWPDGFFFDEKWLQFSAGIACFYQIHYAGKRATVFILLYLLAGAVISTLVMQGTNLVGFAFALLLCGLWKRDRKFASVSVLLPVIWCGNMCYSIYLIHWPVCKLLSHSLYNWGVRGLWPTVLVVLPVCLIVTLALAWVFHMLVERRFMNTQTPRPIPESKVANVTS